MWYVFQVFIKTVGHLQDSVTWYVTEKSTDVKMIDIIRKAPLVILPCLCISWFNGKEFIIMPVSHKVFAKFRLLKDWKCALSVFSLRGTCFHTFHLIFSNFWPFCMDYIYIYIYIIPFSINWSFKLAILQGRVQCQHNIVTK
jgi:hypothetical protein